MSTLPLPAIGSPRWESGVALTANSLLAVKLLGQKSQGGIVYTTTQTEDQMQSRFLLDVVIAQGAAIFELFSGKDETLLIRGDTLLVLNFGLNVVDGVRWLNIERDCLTREGLYEDLHGSIVILFSTAAATLERQEVL